MRQSLIFCITLFLSPVLLQAQQPEWFPAGAEWHYTYSSAFSLDIDFNRVNVAGEVVKNGQKCKKLTSSRRFGCNGLGAGNYVYEDSSKVYFYNINTDSFQLLYDFTAQAGDSWTISEIGLTKEDSIIVLVDSTDTTNINGHNLKVLYLRDTSELSGVHALGYKNAMIIEYIGSLTSFFPWVDGTCDGNFSAPLRCYEAPEFGFYQKTSEPCDTTWTSVANPKGNAKPITSVTPQPVNNASTIRVEGLNHAQFPNAHCLIYDAAGRKVRELSPTSTTQSQLTFSFDGSATEQGLYFFSIITEEGLVSRGKFVVQ